MMLSMAVGRFAGSKKTKKVTTQNAVVLPPDNAFTDQKKREGW